MSETPLGAQDDSEQPQPGAEQPQPRSELVAELQQLGQQLETAFHAFVAGPGKSIGREIGSALADLGAQMQRAVSAIQTQPSAAELERRARLAAQQVVETPVVREVESTLVSGLQQLNQQLRRLIERIETQPAAQQTPADQPRNEAGATLEAPRLQRLTIERDDAPASDERPTPEWPTPTE